MRLWQGVWDSRGKFFLWAEDSKRARDRTAIDGTTTTHPFACAPEELATGISELGFDLTETTEITLLLPSDATGPTASPRIAVGDSAAQRTLRKWSFPALTLTPLEAASVLTSLPKEPTDTFRFDHSLSFWREATCFILELLARGRFLPGVSRAGPTARAIWQPVAAEDADQNRLGTLVSSIPPLCLALESERNDPAFIIDSFVQEVVNALIRSFIRAQPLHSSIAEEPIAHKFPLATQWLSALSSGDGALSGDQLDFRGLEQKLKVWAGKFFGSSQKFTLQTALQIHAPAPRPDDTSEARWQVEFLVRSVHDESQALPARELWNGTLGFLANTDHNWEEIEQLLLTDLGRISDHVPAIRMALLKEPYPTHATLSTREAYSFMREAARLTELSGVGVIYPEWWNRLEASVGLRLRVNAPELPRATVATASVIGSKELLSFDWEIALGNSTLTVEKFQELVEKHSPLVEVDGTWIELPPERVAATLAFIEKQKKKSSLTALEALRLGLTIEAHDEIFPIIGFTASGWIRQLLDTNQSPLTLIEQPEKFQGQLRPYQREGISWLDFLSRANVGGCLADDMGLGKTIQFLALILHEQGQSAKKLDPTLLVVPMSILDNWYREATRFAPTLKLYLHHGPERLVGQSFFQTVEQADLVLTTYSLIYRDEQLFQRVRWERIALDEAQNIKNLSTKQTQAVRALCRNQLSDSDRERECRRLVLTGTPLENHLEELWSVFDFLNPGILGSVAEFRSRFAVPIERDRDRDAAQALSRVIRPFVLRRLKTDSKVISDLPEKIEIDEHTGLTNEQAALYQKMLNSMLTQIDKSSGIHRKGLVLSTITKLKQICNHPTLLLHDNTDLGERSAKVNRLSELIEVILSEKDKLLVFTQYAQMGHLLKPFLEEQFNQEVLFLHGSLPRAARDEVITKFQKKDGPSLFILSLKAGGLGLNLTEANQVIHFDQWWNPAVHEQATDRAYRIGQKRNVQVRTFICKGTLEERIHQMLQSKKDLAEQIVGATKNIITEMSTDELQSLLSLSAEYLAG